MLEGGTSPQPPPSKWVIAMQLPKRPVERGLHHKVEIRLKASILDPCEGDKTFGSEHWFQKDHAMTNGALRPQVLMLIKRFAISTNRSDDSQNADVTGSREIVNCRPEGDG